MPSVRRCPADGLAGLGDPRGPGRAGPGRSSVAEATVSLRDWPPRTPQDCADDDRALRLITRFCRAFEAVLLLVPAAALLRAWWGLR
jgi:hypothetical protein